jgi:hypothetical protein
LHSEGAKSQKKQEDKHKKAKADGKALPLPHSVYEIFLSLTYIIHSYSVDRWNCANWHHGEEGCRFSDLVPTGMHSFLGDGMYSDIEALD